MFIVMPYYLINPSLQLFSVEKYVAGAFSNENYKVARYEKITQENVINLQQFYHYRKYVPNKRRTRTNAVIQNVNN